MMEKGSQERDKHKKLLNAERLLNAMYSWYLREPNPGRTPKTRSTQTLTGIEYSHYWLELLILILSCLHSLGVHEGNLGGA